MSSRTISTSLGSLLLIPLAAFVVNCREVECRKAGNFFSDGGEPFAQEMDARLFEHASGPRGLSSAKPLWYAHEPWKNCANCHATQRQTPSSGQSYFIAEVPKLCHKCHADPTASASFVHGPVAVGECLFCHYPHKSRVEHLLKEPVPELCYLCHDTNDIESIPAHLIEDASNCTDCHYAHAGSARALLKDASFQLNSGAGLSR